MIGKVALFLDVYPEYKCETYRFRFPESENTKMKKKKKLSLAGQIFIALILAIIAGLLMQSHAEFAENYIKPFGTIFLNLLKFIVVPIVLFSIMSGIISMSDIKKVGSIGLKTVIYYFCTTAFAITFGLLFGNFFKNAFPVVATTDLSYEVTEAPSLMDTIVNIFPSNFIAPMSESNMLQVIVMALIFGFSISTSLVPIEWEKAKINILDTPGYFDFVGEVEEAVSAADAAVIVVSGKAGVQVGTEKAWELCDKYNLPRMIYVTEMDVDDASFRQVVEDLTTRYGKKIAPHFQPIRENEKLVGYINVIKNAGRRYTEIGQREECEIPDYCKPNLEILRDSLMEAVAETSEEFMERYFNGEEFSVEEIRSAMRTDRVTTPSLYVTGAQSFYSLRPSPAAMPGATNVL